MHVVVLLIRIWGWIMIVWIGLLAIRNILPGSTVTIGNGRRDRGKHRLVLLVHGAGVALGRALLISTFGLVTGHLETAAGTVSFGAEMLPRNVVGQK